MKRIQFPDPWVRGKMVHADVEVTRYADDSTALLLNEEGERYATASVNLSEYGFTPRSPDLVWLKTWSENEGLVEHLIDCGVVELVGAEVTLVYGNVAVLARINPEYLT